MNFFYYESKFKMKKKLLGGRGWFGVGTGVSEFFFTKTPNLQKQREKKTFFFLGGGGGGVRGGVKGGVGVSGGWLE